MTTWEQVLAELEQWVGYCEKKTGDAQHIEDKIANAGYNNYNRFAKWFDEECPGFLNKEANKEWVGWCTVFLPYPICHLFGRDKAKAFFGCPEGAANMLLSVGGTANYFKAQGRFYGKGSGFDPQAGDVIFMDMNGNGELAHVGWVIGRAENGKVVTIEGNTGRVEGMPYCGGCVAKKQYWTYDKRITAYARPDWRILEGAEEGQIPAKPTDEESPKEPSCGLICPVCGARFALCEEGGANG